MASRVYFGEQNEEKEDPEVFKFQTMWYSSHQHLKIVDSQGFPYGRRGRKGLEWAEKMRT